MYSLQKFVAPPTLSGYPLVGQPTSEQRQQKDTNLIPLIDEPLEYLAGRYSDFSPQQLQDQELKLTGLLQTRETQEQKAIIQKHLQAIKEVIQSQAWQVASRMSPKFWEDTLEWLKSPRGVIALAEFSKLQDQISPPPTTWSKVMDAVRQATFNALGLGLLLVVVIPLILYFSRALNIKFVEDVLEKGTGRKLSATEKKQVKEAVQEVRESDED